MNEKQAGDFHPSMMSIQDDDNPPKLTRLIKTADIDLPAV